jgi:hypothetical protein
MPVGALLSFTALRELRKLNLSYLGRGVAKPVDLGSEPFQVLTRLPNLTWLDVTGVAFLTPEVIALLTTRPVPFAQLLYKIHTRPLPQPVAPPAPNPSSIFDDDEDE